MDWNGCDLVEVIPGKVSGRPVVKNTRIPADVVVSNFESGSPVDEIMDNYPSLSLAQIEALLAFARARQMQIALG
jgi:uncharacterized protein (DUF433 family)